MLWYVRTLPACSGSSILRRSTDAALLVGVPYTARTPSSLSSALTSVVFPDPASPPRASTGAGLTVPWECQYPCPPTHSSELHPLGRPAASQPSNQNEIRSKTSC